MRAFAFIIFSLALPLMLEANDPENGKELFRNYCKACHNLDQNLVGPALQGVHERRTEEWIYSFVKSSTSVIESGDSTANALFMQFNQIPMPDQNLSDAQISDILSYIRFEGENTVQEETRVPRPQVAPKPNITPLNFGDFRFWIVYTVVVVIMIGVLYYMVEITDLGAKMNVEE